MAARANCALQSLKYNMAVRANCALQRSSSDLSLDQWSVGAQTYSTCTILGFKGIPKCDNGHYMYLLYNSLPFIGISSICVE
jgi:hypothetical protein